MENETKFKARVAGRRRLKNREVHLSCSLSSPPSPHQRLAQCWAQSRWVALAKQGPTHGTLPSHPLPWIQAPPSRSKG